MQIRGLSGKKVCVLGYGREGRATVAALLAYAKGCEITVADQEKMQDIPSECWNQTGTGWLQNLEKFDVLIVSPGIPPLPEIQAEKAKITNATQIFLDTVKEQGSTVVGVTGSKGKSTTASLIALMLKASGKDVHLVGNIGEPAISHLKDAKLNTIFVHEMSSYQLMLLHSGPDVAVVTSFFPEHLDYHGSEAAYLDAKKNITRFQTKDGVVFFAAGSKDVEMIAGAGTSRKIPYSERDALVPLREMRLIGEHNLRNAAGAWKAAELLGADRDSAAKVLREFPGLPHRLELLGVHGGRSWVNDSISTTPESAVAALDALGSEVTTVILGGHDRGYDFTSLGERIAGSPEIKTVILLPESGEAIEKALKASGARAKISHAATVEEAVQLVKEESQTSRINTQNFPVVLLSPASPSYGVYKNFEERGERFKAAVLAATR